MLTHLSLAEKAQAYLECSGTFHVSFARLVLRQCSLTSACCKYMMSSFKNNQSLQSLVLSFNRRMDGGVILLCSALAGADCSLLVLEPEHCWFTSASCHALASMLCKHKKLRYLDLSKHIIGLNGMLTLALAFFSQRRAEEVVLKKKSNDSVGMHIRLQGPE
ncbi:hypothetical protein U0070_018323 [Myodes glareolus]|uniref:Uncharacterized protein n=1 Tax=Myodes glareolus TaxID=447135 RepID=A0AAW0JUA1_MYOGA